MAEATARLRIVGRGEFSVSDAIQLYTTNRYKQGEFSRSTAESQGYSLRSVAEIMGDPLIADLAHHHVETWLQKAALAPATKRTRLSQFRTLCKWAMAHGLLKRDPTLGVKGPSQPRRLPRGLPHQDVAHLLGGCPDARAVLIVLLMVQEGLRRIEVARLNLGDVDLTEGTLFVRGKGSHERILPITDETRQALSAYLSEHPAHAGPLIRSYVDGRSPLTPGHVGRLVADWMRDSGVKQRAWDGRSAHACRHTAATDTLRAGAHLRDVQRMLGHQSLTTTERYLPWVVGELREAMGGRRYKGS